MQAVSQSYNSLAYTQVQTASVFPENRKETDRSTEGRSFSPSSSQSTNDPITLSAKGKELSRADTSQTDSGAKNQSPADTKDSKDTTKGTGQQTLSQEELKAMAQLQQRDTEVRSHEQAHLSAAGQYAAGGASFSYTTGPNGKRYAVGGEVPIDISKEKTPEATIQKMRTVRRAALAPASPSGTDRNIAAQASSIEAQAMQDILQESKIASSSESTSPESIPPEIPQQNQQPVTQRLKNSIDSNTPPEVTDFNRKVMNSAYQSVAALVS